MGREFSEREKETLDRIRLAAEDPTGVERLALVSTSRNGEPCSVLCILTTDVGSGLCRVQPVAVLLTPEEAMKIENPVTGVPGLPWADCNPAQIKLEGVD